MNFIKKFVQNIKNEMAGIEVKGSIEVKSSESNKQTEELEYDLITDFNGLKQQANTVYFNEAKLNFLEKVNKYLWEENGSNFYSFGSLQQYFSTEFSDTEGLHNREVEFIVYVLRKYFKSTHEDKISKTSLGRIRIETEYPFRHTGKIVQRITKEEIIELLELEIDKQQILPVFNRKIQQEDYKLYYLAFGFLKSAEKLKQDFPFQYQKFGYQFSDTVQNITRIIKNEYDELGELSTENEKIILSILQPIWEEMDSKYKELTIKQKEYEKEMRETSIQSRAELLKMELEIVNKIREKQSTTESNDIANIILNDINKEKGDE